jgi:hypothetical protein
MMTQMSAKAAIRKHGKAAEDALMAEFSQMETWRNTNQLTRTHFRGNRRKTPYAP